MTINIAEVFPSLTKRQREVCALLVKGYTAKQIGPELGIKWRTVNEHKEAIFRTMEVGNVAELAWKLCGAPEMVV